MRVMTETKFAIIFFVAFMASGIVHAQVEPKKFICEKGKIVAKHTVADPAEDNYDVKYVKLNLSLTDTSVYLSGDVTTRAITTVTSFTDYVFELDTLMVIDSVLINGIMLPYSTTGFVRTIHLSTPLSSGNMFTAQVFYHGHPFSVPGFAAVDGMNSGTGGIPATFSQGECYHAKEWWPCKQSLKDKIDSVDFWVTIPSGLKAGCNGLLKDTTIVSPGFVRYEWAERYPIDYYLISVAVARYRESSYKMTFSGSTDSMLVQNYLLDNSNFATNVAITNSVGAVIDYFSGLFGRYPFWKEKYGHCIAGTSGMENQTMTTLKTLDMVTITHELGHQWFGDNVTCATWSDIIMNEGFAMYATYCYKDQFENHASAITYIAGCQNSAKSTDTGSCYVLDTTDENRIFDGRLTYSKGAGVIHMLRGIINNDNHFFKVLKNYQAHFGGGNGSINDLKNEAESLLGINVNGTNLDTFFTQWAYGQGYPIYNIKWSQHANDLFIKVDQRTADSVSVPFFKLPLEFFIDGSFGTTSYVGFNDTVQSQIFHCTFPESILSISPDPNNWLIYGLVSITMDTSLSIAMLPEKNIFISPNPATSAWHISSLPPDAQVILYDAFMRQIWHHKCNGQSIDVPAEQLYPGLYFLYVSGDMESPKVFKLVKQ